VAAAVNRRRLTADELRAVEVAQSLALAAIASGRATRAELLDVRDLLRIGVELARAGIGAELLDDLQRLLDDLRQALAERVPVAAVAALLPRLPAHFPTPIVIVQHMPPIFTRLLAERLAAQSALPVAEAAAGEVLAPGQIRLAPGGSHLALERHGIQVRLQLNQDPPENSCRPAVDVLFRSVAEVYRANALAVVMTGMGNDGLKGCEAIRRAGGQILAQDESSSVVWGMPGFVAKAGLADGQIALPQLAGEILTRVRTAR